MAKNKVQIVVATYEAHLMGFVIIDGKRGFTGNYWDFHSGFHGTNIGGYEIKDLGGYRNQVSCDCFKI